MSDSPRIYVACLAAYNAGKLHGVWIDFDEDMDEDKAQEMIDAMIQRSPTPFAEEWDIHDSENFASFQSNDLEVLVQVAALIHEHGENAVEGFIAHVGKEYIKDMIDQFEDVYIGEFASEEDCVESHIGDEGGLCSAAEGIQVFDYATLDQYIDWEAIANDAFTNCYFSHHKDGKVYAYHRQ